MFSLYLFQHLTCHILNVGRDSESLRKLGGALRIYWPPSGSSNTKKSLILTLSNPASPPPCPHATPQFRKKYFDVSLLFLDDTTLLRPWQRLLSVPFFSLSNSDFGYLKLRRGEAWTSVLL